MEKKIFLKLSCLALLAFAAVTAGMPVARADILIMPVRAVFENRDRTADVTVMNTSDVEATFKMSLINQRQNPSGGYKMEQTPPDPAVDLTQMIAFSPRQVTLPPNGRQRVRLSLRRPPDMPEGEYHVHLNVTQEKGSNPDLSSDGPIPQGKLKMDVAINVSFSIPVIVRNGRSDAAVTISNPKFIAGADGGPALLQVTLSRTGRFGTMGRLRAYWTPPGGDEKQIGALNNVNIFTELSQRTANIRLKESRIVGGTIRVVYEGGDDGLDKGVTFDEKIIPVGG